MSWNREKELLIKFLHGTSEGESFPVLPDCANKRVREREGKAVSKREREREDVAGGGPVFPTCKVRAPPSLFSLTNFVVQHVYCQRAGIRRTRGRTGTGFGRSRTHTSPTLCPISRTQLGWVSLTSTPSGVSRVK